jgi:hypothetical protein
MPVLYIGCTVLKGYTHWLGVTSAKLQVLFCVGVKRKPQYLPECIMHFLICTLTKYQEE